MSVLIKLQFCFNARDKKSFESLKSIYGQFAEKLLSDAQIVIRTGCMAHTHFDDYSKVTI
jgi:hypothetical protein